MSKERDLLDRAAESFADREAPDENWWREYLELTGQQWILYEEGWEPGCVIESYLAEDPEWEPFDEVNAPQRGDTA